MENKNIIIGITGAFGSGKSTAAAFFASNGFKIISLSNFLEEEAKKRGFKKITRKILQDLGNEFREKYSSGVLAKKALQAIGENKITKVVIDGIRNPDEIEVLRKNKNFKLLAIISDREVRFKRLQKVKRREELTRELFSKLDHRDFGLGQKKTGLHVSLCIALADNFITNNQNLDDFYKELKKYLEKNL